LLILEIRLLVLGCGSKRIDESDVESGRARCAVFLRECRPRWTIAESAAVKEIRDGGQGGQVRSQLVPVAEIYEVDGTYESWRVNRLSVRVNEICAESPVVGRNRA